MAHHDGLTNLPNRDFYQDRLAQALERSQAGNKRVAVLCVDLDLFKNVNDSFGHPMGDRLLKAVAERLEVEVRGDNLVARLGGDEFAMILASDVSPNEASDFADRLIRILSARYDIDGIELVDRRQHRHRAVARRRRRRCEELMRNADMALYRAKSDGGGVHRFFEREMDRQAQKRRDMELDLRRAFANGEFELHYQPLVDIARRPDQRLRIAAALAASRKGHDLAGGLHSGRRGHRLDRRARRVGAARSLHRGGEMARRRQGRGQSVAGAVSQPQSGSGGGLGAGAFRACRRCGSSLKLPNSLFLAETEANLAILHQLRELGVSISMDDFGTGYSSLSYLRSFPFDKIKIDRSFIKDLAERSDCVAIVRAISGLGRSLNITTTAEGVETIDQLDWLRAEGCNEVQGFLFSAARPAAEVEQLLSKFGRRASQAA